jgi:hypothetical protein
MARVKVRPSSLLLVLTFGVLSLQPASASATATSSRTNAAAPIARAFATLSDPPPVDRGAPFLEGYDSDMRRALETAAGHLADQDAERASVTFRVGRIEQVQPGQAVVPLTIHIGLGQPSEGYTEQYAMVALRTRGHWQVSWTSMCLLVESEAQICPAVPRGVATGDVLPEPAGRADLTPGLVDPGPLATAPDGSLLIADQARNQILRYRDGALSVVAGNGLEGFAGDGGPAPAAQLNGPGEMAVSRSGTIYFVDSGNDRVRAIAPDGVITTVAGDGSPGAGTGGGDGGPATRAPLDPSGLALGPTGALYIASGSDIRVVEPDGIIETLVRGGAPAGVDVSTAGGPMAFFPESMAVDGQGNLIVFSFSPKLLFEVTPAGQVTELAPDYATALAPAPDGSVLMAEHGTGIEQVEGSAVSALVSYSRGSVPGLAFGLAPEGIAEAANGTIYVDTEPGDGFTDQTGLFAMTDGVTRAVPVTTSLLDTLPAVGAPGFPAATYPATAPAVSRRALSSCPSPAGVVPFDRAAAAQARQLMAFWNTNLSYDLHASDRAAWPADVVTFTGRGDQGRQSIMSVTRASDDLYAAAVARACGASLVQDSLAIVMGPSVYSSAVEHLFLLDRGGTPLVYFVDR